MAEKLMTGSMQAWKIPPMMTMTTGCATHPYQGYKEHQNDRDDDPPPEQQLAISLDTGHPHQAEEIGDNPGIASDAGK